AQRFDTSTTTIQQLNELDGSLRTGEKLVLPAPWSLLTKRSESDTQGTAAQHAESARDSGEKSAQYRVRQGDTPWRIAQQHGISVDELARLNGEAKVASLRPGMLLQVRSQDQAAATQRRDPTAERPSMQKAATQRVDYRVRKGDTLYRIASRFKLPVEKILEWNESVRGEQTIKPGDQVTLYVEPQKLPAES
ncbi:MAG: LysM peptidoglycan-binding domain-containing protein, partial [Pseudomonadales bacterium]|nr:LysM peptidoglycan-binding domain-containing protein [Pseudomonadales bacterium]